MLTVVLPLLLGQGERGRDARELLLEVVENQEHNQDLQRQYTCLETVTTEHFDKDGTVSKTESETFEVIPTAGGEYRRLVARDGQTLSPVDKAKEEDKYKKFLESQRELSPDERRAAEDKLKNRAGRFETRLRQAIEVFNFSPLPDEELSGRRLRVFRFTPRPDYEAKVRATKLLQRLEGKIWIDPQQHQIVKLHLWFREDMKFLLGLFGRISKGTEAVAVQKRVGDEIWVLDNVDVTLYGRMYFLKRYRQRITYAYTDYREVAASTEESLPPQ